MRRDWIQRPLLKTLETLEQGLESGRLDSLDSVLGHQDGRRRDHDGLNVPHGDDAGHLGGGRGAGGAGGRGRPPSVCQSLGDRLDGRVLGGGNGRLGGSASRQTGSAADVDPVSDGVSRVRDGGQRGQRVVLDGRLDGGHQDLCVVRGDAAGWVGAGGAAVALGHLGGRDARKGNRRDEAGQHAGGGREEAGSAHRRLWRRHRHRHHFARGPLKHFRFAPRAEDVVPACFGGGLRGGGGCGGGQSRVAGRRSAGLCGDWTRLEALDAAHGAWFLVLEKLDEAGARSGSWFQGRETLLFVRVEVRRFVGRGSRFFFLRLLAFI